MDTVQLGLHELGPFNWLGKRILSEKVTDNVRVLIETKSKEIIKEVLRFLPGRHHLVLIFVQVDTIWCRGLLIFRKNNFWE